LWFFWKFGEFFQIFSNYFQFKIGKSISFVAIVQKNCPKKPWFQPITGVLKNQRTYPKLPALCQFFNDNLEQSKNSTSHSQKYHRTSFDP